MTIFIRVVDLETTGFAPPDHSPCEIGFVDLVSTGADLTEAPARWIVDQRGGLGILCNPLRPIPPETSAVHHIIDADVASRRAWPDVLAEVITDEPFAYAAHSAKFERQWITDDLTGGKPWICTYKCALRLWPESPTHSNQGLRYWRKPIGLDRQIAAVAHRAMPDAYVTAFLLREMLQLAPIADLIAWSSQPALLPRVTFGQHRGKPWTDVDTGLLYWVLDRDFDEDVLFTARAELDRRRAAAASTEDEHEEEF